jgi:glycosyltransferase involved in cell wall biosynthesis
MPFYFKMADLYVTPSLLEGFGLPLAEALACGTPVVAAYGGATSEVIGPGGLLVPPRDSPALADAISELLQDRARRKSLGWQGREHILNQFSLKQMLDSTLDAYAKFA